MEKILVNKSDHLGNTPLLLASQKGDLEMLLALLEKPKIDPNRGNERGCTPLLIATHHGYVPIVLVLLKLHHIDASLASKNGVNFLSLSKKLKKKERLMLYKALFLWYHKIFYGFLRNYGVDFCLDDLLFAYIPTQIGLSLDALF